MWRLIAVTAPGVHADCVQCPDRWISLKLWFASLITMSHIRLLFVRVCVCVRVCVSLGIYFACIQNAVNNEKKNISHVKSSSNPLIQTGGCGFNGEWAACRTDAHREVIQIKGWIASLKRCVEVVARCPATLLPTSNKTRGLWGLILLPPAWLENT